MIKKLLLTILILSVATPCIAAEFTCTPKGKIESTQGRTVSNCTTVWFVDNSTGDRKRFKIDSGYSDIRTVVLSALMENKDVKICYLINPVRTTGCGDDPMIINIVIYNSNL